jgi:hypothetical protein
MSVHKKFVCAQERFAKKHQKRQPGQQVGV